MTSEMPSSYGDAFADVYDRWYENITDAEATARFVAMRAAAELPVLELGVGTGRLVGPMIRAGLHVVGVDASAAMLEICATAHPEVSLILADLATFSPTKPIGGALCAFNTLFNLTRAEDQLNLITQIGKALTPGAPLVVEAITGFGLDQAPEQSVGLSEVDPERTVMSATVVDAVSQTITGQHVEYEPDNTIKKRNWQLRWSTVVQLDEMASAAGLKLSERYADWSQTAFEESSQKHISVYVKR